MLEGVVVESMDYQELLLGFISGLIIGIVIEYIRHYLSVKWSKKEAFLPYLRKLYASVSEIMKKTDAKELNERYDRLINARIEEKMRESAIRELSGKKTLNFLCWRVLCFSVLFFLHR